ncbi:MAG: hypothetical protein QXT47_00075 [Desulfurococcaceae archaeon]
MNFKITVFTIMLILTSLVLVDNVSASLYRIVDRNYKFVYHIENRIRSSIEYYIVEVIETTLGVERILRLKITYDNGSFKTYQVETIPESALSLYIPVLSDYDVTRLIAEGKSTLSFPIRVSDWNKPINETQPFTYKTILLKPRDYDTTITLSDNNVVRAVMCSAFDEPYLLTIYIDQRYGLLLKLIAIDIRTGNETIVVNLEYANILETTREQTTINRSKLEEKITKYLAIVMVAVTVAIVVYIYSRID